MASTVRVVHYINQFFAGIGGEEEAYHPLEVRDGPVGPGRALQQALGDQGTVVGTIIAGDNYFVEEQEEALPKTREAFDQLKPDLVVAGPAFDAGRYGLACALVCKLAAERNIAAVTGMDPENVGVLTYRRDIFAVPTGISTSELASAMGKMAALGLKLSRGEELGAALEEGYVPRGFRRPVIRKKLGYERAVEMLIARATDKPFVSEVQVKSYESIAPAPPVESMSDATLALITSGGLVPRGNPDRLVSGHATDCFKYSIDGLDALSVDDWESVHGGFNTTYLNTVNPNYALPLPRCRELERQGVFKKLYPYYFATTGNGTAVTDARHMGAEIAEELISADVKGALLVAT
jgi:glycine reductase